MPNINEFIAKFKGGARANLYEVVISGFDEDLKFLAKATATPGKDIGQIEVNYQNHTIPYRGDVVFQDWHVTVLLDQDMNIKKKLEDWLEKIQSSTDIQGGGALTEYARDAEVTLLGTDGSPIAVYKLKYIWPIGISPIEVSYDSKDTILELDVNFKITYYETDM